MSNVYNTLSDSEKLKLLNSSEHRKYKMIGHQWKPLRGVGKNVCSHCGLVALRNKFTDWCVDKGCDYTVHSQYKSARTRYTKL